MKKFSVKTIVAIGIGAALFFVLGRFVAIPSPVPNTNISVQYGLLAFLSVVYGPVAGALVGFIGHALIDFSYGWGIWWSWVIASGVFGLHFGLSIHTREYSEKTAEYLFTKPCSRREIFIAKALTVCCGVLLVSAAYMAASALALLLFRPHIPWGEFALVVGSFPLLTLFFAALGLLLGTLWPNNRSPLLTAGMLIFVEYCITSFSRVTSLPAISYLSPYSYFNAAEMAQLGGYSGTYLLCYGILLLTFLLLAYRIFLRRNILLH